MYNDVSLTMLKKQLVERYDYSRNHQNKLFALRCGFDEINDTNRTVINVQQLTVSINGYSGFSRTVERINKQKETDFCEQNQNNFTLRMKPVITNNLNGFCGQQTNNFNLRMKPVC